jgi:hypothetical protein
VMEAEGTWGSQWGIKKSDVVSECYGRQHQSEN